MLTIIIIIYSLLIFPIFVNGKLSINNEQKRINYSVNLGVFKLLYGYFELDKEGIIIHLTRRKAVLIRFSDLLSIRKKFKPLKDYHLLKYNSTLDLGISGSEISIEFLILYSFITQIIGEIINVNKPYFEVYNTLNIYEDSKISNYRLKINLVFNLLMVIIRVFRIIVEKIIYAIKSRAKQN